MSQEFQNEHVHETSLRSDSDEETSSSVPSLATSNSSSENEDGINPGRTPVMGQSPLLIFDQARPVHWNMDETFPRLQNTTAEFQPLDTTRILPRTSAGTFRSTLASGNFNFVDITYDEEPSAAIDDIPPLPIIICLEWDYMIEPENEFMQEIEHFFMQ